jgi:putative hydrolase of the HAD superfamily
MPTIVPPPEGAASGRSGGRRAGFDHIDCWIFDLDNTLYPASCNLFPQVDRRIGEFIATFLKVDPDEARRVQKEYFREYGTTLRGMMTRHAMLPDQFLEYVHTIDLSVVPPSPTLDRALERLSGRKIIYTNGSVRHAERVMARIGVDRHFHGVFDIVAADYQPKPDPSGYARLLERHRIDPRAAVMIEDIPRNLAPAAALGMTTVLVRTQDEWAQDGADGDFIHHITDDLVAWLEAAASHRS